MKAVIRRMKHEAAGVVLWETLRREGWYFLTDEEPPENRQEDGKPYVCLVVTDSQEGAEYARKRSLACLAYEPVGNPYHFSGVDMVAEDLNELNGECLQMIWKRHEGLPWTIAVTRNLILRESILEDLDDFYQIYGGEGITDYMPGLSQDREREKADLDLYIKNMYRFFNYGLWTVLERKTGDVIGRVGLENSEDPETGEPVLELGYLIGKPWQGKGYGMEAADAAAQYAFAAVAVPELFLFIDERNQISRRVGARLQERYPGKIRIVLLKKDGTGGR